MERSNLSLKYWGFRARKPAAAHPRAFSKEQEEEEGYSILASAYKSTLRGKETRSGELCRSPLHSFRAQDEIVVIKQETRGQAAARNAGVNTASGEIVFVLRRRSRL